MSERVDTNPTESIPPSVLMDRVLERSDRTMREGFVGIRKELAATRRHVIGALVIAMVLLGARDFGKFLLETAFMRIETSASPTATSTVGSTP